MTQKDTAWVEYAKAIGIMLVVYGHVARGIYHSGIDLPVPFYKLADSLVYSFHMPLFFFLSGLFFVTSLQKRGPKKLVFSKIDTIFYPYLLWSMLQGSLEVLLPSYTNGSPTFTDVLSLLWAPRAHFWFLYALLLIFALSTLAYRLLPQRFSAVFGIFSIIMYLTSSMISDDKIINYITENTAFFALGIIFLLHIKTQWLDSKLALVGLFLAFILGQWIFHGYLSLEYRDRGIQSLLLAIISIGFIVSLSIHLAKFNLSFFAYLGRCSMAIYLMHVVAGGAARALLSQLGIHSFIEQLVIGFIFALLAPLAVLVLINKLKIPYMFSAPLCSCLANIFAKAAKFTHKKKQTGT
ncbi:acyltransferase family protein [Shewanella sp. 10N.286.51.B8]|uniref:acyltransferase family protein n=1 Tax=Shewanella sp. 10N.286.51.B8 TaxID=3229708 RepID=UPI003552052B